MTTPFIWDWVHEHAQRTPDAPAVATPDVRLSYGQLASRARTLDAALAAGGVAAGDRVLVALPNSVATVVADLALHSLGACVVEVNRAWRAETLQEIVHRSGARQAFVLGQDAVRWADASRSHPLRFWVLRSAGSAPDADGVLGGAVAAHVDDEGRVDSDLRQIGTRRRTALSPDAPAVILFTSGSTGKPHGVIQTSRNLDANTRSIVQYLRLTAADRAMVVLPLSYSYGRSVLQTHLFVGGSVFLDNRFMYPRVVLERIRAEGCTGLAGVPATFELIRRQVDVFALGPLGLRYVTQAGEEMSRETIRWVRRVFAPAPLFVMYGQTEATARLSYLPPERAEEKVGSIGVAIPGVELKVVDDDARELAIGQVGHLLARGDNVTPGYLDEPEETARILRDGWLWTGDLARRDADGFFFHAGRSKEILKIAGHRVSPAEIEALIARHPDVAEAAVVGRAHELMGEVAAAFVVRRAGATVNEAHLRRYCAEHLPPFKVPETITFVDTLPRNEAGKLMRARLAVAPTPAREREAAYPR